MYKISRLLLVCVLLFSSFFFNSFTLEKSNLKITHLTCEYISDPISISTKSPHFGWEIDSEERGVMQSAYAIELYLETDDGVNKIWDSGKIKSNQSQRVKYQGKKRLIEGGKYQWRVRVWDNKKNRSGWSKMNVFRIAPSFIDSEVHWCISPLNHRTKL